MAYMQMRALSVLRSTFPHYEFSEIWSNMAIRATCRLCAGQVDVNCEDATDHIHKRLAESHAVCAEQWNERMLRYTRRERMKDLVRPEKEAFRRKHPDCVIESKPKPKRGIELEDK